MTFFSSAFFTLTQSTQNNDESLKEAERVYGREILHYLDIICFERCKEQLLKLLDYIVELNPKTLKIFADYRNNIEQSLTLALNDNDIAVTLRAAKTRLESSLRLIQENHKNISPNTFNAYTVTACFSGAYSNLESILEHFNQNNLADLIVSTKKKMLQTFIHTFLKEGHVDIPPGNEIHMVNGLYNLFADAYGCPTAMDHLANTHFSEQAISYCKRYINTHFTLSNFLRNFIIMLPMLPPRTTINSPELLSEVDTFFRFLGIEDKEKYHLYTLDDNCIDLLPRPNFSTYLKCIIVSALEKKNYLEKQVYWDLKPHSHLRTINIGKKLVGLKKNEDEESEYFVLDEEMIISAFEHEKNNKYISRLLVSQSPQLLYNQLENPSAFLYNQSINHHNTDIKKYLIGMLLKKKHLPQDIVVNLFHFISNNNADKIKSIKPTLAKYVYERFYPLEKEILHSLAENFTNAELIKYCLQANTLDASENKYAYRRALINKMPIDNLKQIISLNPTTDNLNMLLKLHECLIPNLNWKEILNIKLINTTLAHKAAEQGNIDFLRLLKKYEISLDSKNYYGETPAFLAIFYQKPEVFCALAELGANLQIADKNGNTLIDKICNHPDLNIDMKAECLRVISQHCNLMPIHIGNQIVGLKKHESVDNRAPEYLGLDEKLIISALESQEGNEEIDWKLTIQSPQLLYNLLVNSSILADDKLKNQINSPIKELFIQILLAKKNLPQDIVINLFHFISKSNEDEIKKTEPVLAKYVYERFYPLEKKILQHLAEKFTLEELEKHFELIIKSSLSEDKYTHLEIVANKLPANKLKKTMDSFKYSTNTALILNKLLKHNSNINWKDILNPKRHKGITLAHNAAAESNIEFLKLLKEYEINLDVQDNYLGWTPAFHAIKNKQEEAFCALADLGANLQIVDKNGNTLAHQICKEHASNIETKTKWLTLIAQKGAKLDQENNDKITPLEILPKRSGEKIRNKISNVINLLMKEQEERNNQLTIENNILGARPRSILNHFDETRASQIPKRHTEDTIHPSSPSNSPQP